MFTWELDGPAEHVFGTLPQLARSQLARLMDAVIFDPFEYGHKPGDARTALRTLPFGLHGEGLVVFLVYAPDRLVLVVQITWP